MSHEPNFEVAERQTMHVTVRWVDHNDPPLEADGPGKRRFLLNTRVMGELWGKVEVGDVLEVDILPNPGKATRILAVRRPTA